MALSHARLRKPSVRAGGFFVSRPPVWQTEGLRENPAKSGVVIFPVEAFSGRKSSQDLPRLAHPPARTSLPAHRARAYTSLVGPGPYDGIPLGSTALTMFCIERLNIVWGDEAKPLVFIL